MQAYRDALADDNTSFVLSPDSEFFRFFNSPTLAPVEQAQARAAPRQPRTAPLQPAPTMRHQPPADGAGRRPRRRRRRRAAPIGERTRPRWADRLKHAQGAVAGCAPCSTTGGGRVRAGSIVSGARGQAANVGARSGLRVMIDLATAVALVLVLEGLLWAVSPERMKRAVAMALAVADEQLRFGGLVAVGCGRGSGLAGARLTARRAATGSAMVRAFGIDFQRRRDKLRHACPREDAVFPRGPDLAVLARAEHDLVRQKADLAENVDAPGESPCPGFDRIRPHAGARSRLAHGPGDGPAARRRPVRRRSALPTSSSGSPPRWSISRPPRRSARGPMPDLPFPEPPPGSPFEDFFREFFDQRPAAPGDAAAAGLPRLGLRGGSPRLRGHQQPRDRRSRRDPGRVQRRQELRRQAGGAGHQDRSGAAQDRGRPALARGDVCATATRSGSATGSSPSAIRSASAARSPRASSRPARATFGPDPTTISCRSTRRSIAAIPAARASISTAR